MHKISVVIPSYNHEKYIEETINSVLSQTYKPLEIIIIDDGSKDKTSEICELIAGRNPSIKFFKQENQGAHNTINKGIGMAIGDYIAVLNSDDIFLPDKLEKCIKIIENNPKIELVFGNVNFIDSNGQPITTGISIDWQKRALEFLKETNLLPLSILNENFVTTTSNLIFTKKLWEKVEGFQALRYCHDLDFILTALKEKTYFFDKTAHINYRIHQNNTIKETLSKVHVEIASVIAAMLAYYNIDLIEKITPSQIQIFKKFLVNKNLSDTIIFCMMLFLKIGDRKKYYEYIMEEETKSLLSNMLNNQ
jgi:glycosyltransferase involved in cell wall biosynthesis